MTLAARVYDKKRKELFNYERHKVDIVSLGQPLKGQKKACKGFKI